MPVKQTWSFDWPAFRRAIRGKLEVSGHPLASIAEITGVSVPTLSRIENGGACTVEHLIRICEWIGLPLDAFVRKGNS